MQILYAKALFIFKYVPKIFMSFSGLKRLGIPLVGVFTYTNKISVAPLRKTVMKIYSYISSFEVPVISISSARGIRRCF